MRKISCLPWSVNDSSPAPRRMLPLPSDARLKRQGGTLACFLPEVGSNCPESLSPPPYDIALMAFKEFGIIIAGLIGVFGIAFLLTWGACCVCRVRGMPFHPEATRVAHTAVAIAPSLGNYLRRRHPRYRTPEDQPGIPLMTREQPGAVLPGQGHIFSPLATNEFPPSAPSYQANPEGQPEPPVPENTFGIRLPLLP